MSQTIQEKPEGNTKSSGAHTQLYRWFFTCPYEEYDSIQLSQNLRGFSKEFLFSGEIGASGYKHWQGCFSLKQKEYFNTVKNLFPQSIHLEPCKNWLKANNYCKKIETHIEGPYTQDSSFLNLPSKLYSWQQWVVDLVQTNPDDRTIHWLWEKKGCQGKTTLCKILYVRYGANIIGNGAMKDIAYCIDDSPRIVCFNLTRTNEEHINYGAMEAIKDGLVFSSKYESRAKIFNSPHVLVFANFEPRVDSMSRDRWNVVNIGVDLL